MSLNKLHIDKTRERFQKMTGTSYFSDETMMAYVEAFTGYPPNDVLRIIQAFEMLRKVSEYGRELDGAYRLPHEVSL